MRRLVTPLIALLAVAFVALAGAGGWLYWNGVELNGERTARAELGPIATTQVPQVLAYDYQTVERSLSDAYSMLTPRFRQQFEEKANKEIIPQARERQVISQVNVVGVGVMDAHRNSASVMVYINQTWIDKSQKPLYDGSRLRVNYQRIDGNWLIDLIQPI